MRPTHLARILGRRVGVRIRRALPQVPRQLRRREDDRDELTGTRWRALGGVAAGPPYRPHIFGSVLPRLLAFVGASLLALAWTAGTSTSAPTWDWRPRVGLITLWLPGVAAVGLSATLLLQMAGRIRLPYWRP